MRFLPSYSNACEAMHQRILIAVHQPHSLTRFLITSAVGHAISASVLCNKSTRSSCSPLSFRNGPSAGISVAKPSPFLGTMVLTSNYSATRHEPSWYKLVRKASRQESTAMSQHLVLPPSESFRMDRRGRSTHLDSSLSPLDSQSHNGPTGVMNRQKNLSKAVILQRGNYQTFR